MYYMLLTNNYVNIEIHANKAEMSIEVIPNRTKNTPWVSEYAYRFAYT